MLLSAGKVKSEDIDIFLKGAGALDINSVRKKPKVSKALGRTLSWRGLSFRVSTVCCYHHATFRPTFPTNEQCSGQCF